MWKTVSFSSLGLEDASCPPRVFLPSLREAETTSVSRDILTSGHVLRSWMCFIRGFQGEVVKWRHEVAEYVQYWEFGHDCYHDVVDGNSCSNLGVIQGRLSNIYYKCRARRMKTHP